MSKTRVLKWKVGLKRRSDYKTNSHLKFIPLCVVSYGFLLYTRVTGPLGEQLLDPQWEQYNTQCQFVRVRKPH